MANQEQLEILKQGVEAWNKWREENSGIEVDLTKADLVEAKLSQINLMQANLAEADLTKAKLLRANLNFTDFRKAKLTGVDFQRAELYGANFRGAHLKNADFGATYLRDANLAKVNLTKVDFRQADLTNVNLSGAILHEAALGRAVFLYTALNGADFSGAWVSHTIFANVDLSQALNLDKVIHYKESTIGEDTLAASQGHIPESFLRNCGLFDWEIEAVKLHNPDLTHDEITNIQYRIYELRATRAFQISRLFISYSHTDSVFVNKLDHSLRNNHIQFWRDVHDMTAGRMETQIDLAIRQNPTVLLVLSKNSLNSDWVQHEVRKARELEKEMGRDVLCPIALDDSWKSARWPARTMEQVMEYNILDFSAWEDGTTFEAKFAKLLNGLDLFYKKPAE
jgi:uncharacterized protein YjbI with pentapeptide repeats